MSDELALPRIARPPGRPGRFFRPHGTGGLRRVDGVAACYFGAEDYVADLGGVRTPGNAEVATARSLVGIAARLAGEAVRMVHETPGGDLDREFGPDTATVVLKVIAVQLVTGRVEDAAADADSLRELLDRAAAQPQPSPAATTDRLRLRTVDLQLWTATGNYEAAGRELEATEGRAAAAGQPRRDRAQRQAGQVSKALT